MNKICHVNLSRGYRGGERQTELLVRALAARGIHQRLVVRRGEPLHGRLHDVANLETVAVRKPFAGTAPRLLRGAIAHAHEAKAAKVALIANRIWGAPYVLTRRIGKIPGGNPLTRSVYRHAEGVVGVAGSVAEMLREYTRRGDVSVIPSATSDLAVDAVRLEALRARWRGRFVVVNVAALVDSQKGQSHLLRVARRLSVSRPDMHFVLLGDGPDREFFERQASGLQNVSIEGFVDNVGDYLAVAEAFVLPSHHEGIGGACLDAMRFGLPCIASAVDGLPEIVTDADNGLLVAPGDEDELAAALMRVHDSPELALRLGKRGREVAANFSADHMAEAYLRLYKKMGFGSGA